ncbi:uncharacterized protein (TIGR02588 family) [Pontibacter ummariensis]|uniref:TIGR02588 family protein n=1 Tax=Pontibacter ummariensis TaxID=1610492 RepID=A0A239LGV8_9BACT|nr:hypothetical protein [Pontibacter ummariensis]PRY03388.1 uncharacterized protein (TIGR02588 family) [Pontibacter ummariensis]SNT29152.1 TIGR02588 family protein [Pontibacter ummariensis]
MGTESDKEKDKKNAFEWTVFWLSLLLVLTVLGYLGYKVYTYVPTTPNLRVEHRPAPIENTAYRYQVDLYNVSSETAEEAMIQVVLMKDGKEWEKAALTFPFAPQHSKREGWVIFQNNPAKADSVVSNVVSYKQP